MKQLPYSPPTPQNSWPWAGVSWTRSVEGSCKRHLKSPVSLWMFWPPPGRGHWPADAVHPGPGGKEKHSGSHGADSGHSGSHRAGDLHVDVQQLRRCHKSCSRSGAPSLHADGGLGHRGLHVSFWLYNSAVDAESILIYILEVGLVNLCWELKAQFDKNIKITIRNVSASSVFLFNQLG